MEFKQKLTQLLAKDKILYNEPMKNHTTFRIGGAAKILLLPDTDAEIISVMRLCKEENVACFIMGNGSNLLVSDRGFDGVIIKLFKNFSRVDIEDNIITAEAGAGLSGLSAEAMKHVLAGLIFASGIPGTVGGAVYMNAGAYGGEMKDIVFETEYIDKDLNIRTVKGDDHGFSYRNSIFQRNSGVILRTRMKLFKGDKESIAADMEKLARQRREKQPLNLPSAGSAFKRPEKDYAAKLIDDAGLRGFSIGGAQVSEKHAGFIVNKGGASAEDVLMLLEFVKSAVHRSFGVVLQEEIRFIGG